MFTCQLIFLLLLLPTAWATDYVVFTDQTFSISFEEPKVSDAQRPIQVQIDNVLLTPTPTSGGWYVYRPDDRTNSTVYLKNDGIIRNKTSFTVSITFATLAQQTIDFSVLNANITKDFVLPTAQEPESFALVCSYSVSEGETLQSMLWSKGGSADKPVAVENSTSRDNRVLVTSVENGTIQLSVSRIDPDRKYRHGVAEPLTAYSATVLANSLDYRAHYNGYAIVQQLFTTSDCQHFSMSDHICYGLLSFGDWLTLTFTCLLA